MGETESKCICGKEFIIEHGDDRFRRDGKRVYPKGELRNLCSFRCEDCMRPVNESVPGAEYGEALTLPA